MEDRRAGEARKKALKKLLVRDRSEKELREILRREGFQEGGNRGRRRVCEILRLCQ